MVRRRRAVIGQEEEGCDWSDLEPLKATSNQKARPWTRPDCCSRNTKGTSILRTDRQTHRHRETDRYTQTDRYTERETGRQTDR